MRNIVGHQVTPEGYRESAQLGLFALPGRSIFSFMRRWTHKAYELKIDLIGLPRTYLGKWVALDPEDQRVVASGATAAEVYDAASKAGIAEPLITKVIDNYGALVPSLA